MAEESWIDIPDFGRVSTFTAAGTLVVHDQDGDPILELPEVPGASLPEEWIVAIVQRIAQAFRAGAAS